MILKLSIEPTLFIVTVYGKSKWQSTPYTFSLGPYYAHCDTLHFNMFCYASSAVNGGAKAGITTCSLSTDFIISVPDGADNEWKVSMYPTLKTYFFSDLFGFHDQYETLFDDAAESWIGIEKVFNLPTVDLKDE